MMTLSRTDPARPSGLDTYVIRGGEEGAARLNILARTLAPSTTALLNRLGPLEGRTVVDAACGSGEVSLDLARRVGPRGRVIGFDLDAEKLKVASERAHAEQLGNCQFEQADVTAPWSVRNADVVYARFILTHLPDPKSLLTNAASALVPGGAIAVEDIDAEGLFSYPSCPAFRTLAQLYCDAARLKTCDPLIGRRLGILLKGCGYSDVGTALAQPYDDSAKQAVVMTFHGIRDSVLAAKLVTQVEFERLQAELGAFAADCDAIIGVPRIFQAWGVRR